MSIDEIIEQRGGRPIRVLVVDDEQSVRDVFRDFCQSSPVFQVETASSGHEAVQLVGSEDFDIVTIDLVMPETSGLEAIEKIKREKPHLPVVIVTGNATDHLIAEAGRMGGCRVMHKPVGYDEFINELIDVAEQKCGDK